jgi:tetratricopeptide (TPR) repeat protein
LTEGHLDSISIHQFDHTLSNSQKAYYYFQRGKLLGIFNSYHQASEENLFKSIKLDPVNKDAWVCLGECYWKKGDLDKADSCFRWALNEFNQKEIMVRLAMVIRRKATCRKDIEESIKLCQDSLKIDIKYSDGWGKPSLI